PVAGMAVPIALACDLRFASDRASFTTSFSRRGLVAEWGISWLLPRLVGTAHALDLLFSARKIDAGEAEPVGLINRLVPRAAALAVDRARVPALAAHRPPPSVGRRRRGLRDDWTEGEEEAKGEAGRDVRGRWGRPDCGEGVISFMGTPRPQGERHVLHGQT